MANKKIILVGAIISFTVFLMTSQTAMGAELNLPNLEEAGSFISSVKEIGENLTARNAEFDLSLQTPASIWSAVDNWFFETTGVHVIDALKVIGHFIIWFLELILSLFKWLLSLVE